MRKSKKVKEKKWKKQDKIKRRQKDTVFKQTKKLHNKRAERGIQIRLRLQIQRCAGDTNWRQKKIKDWNKG